MAVQFRSAPHDLINAARRRANAQYNLTPDTNFPRRLKAQWFGAFEQALGQVIADYQSVVAETVDGKQAEIGELQSDRYLAQLRLKEAGISLVETQADKLTAAEVDLIKRPLMP